MFNCPSCGGKIEADQRYAYLVVCPYCSSSLVLDQEAARVAGKMATLPAPPGMLFVGARGNWNKKDFAVIGRVRYGWEQGAWDEWYVLFDDGTPYWISEDEGHLTLETCKQLEQAPKSYDELRAGQWIKLGKHKFHIDEKNVATCEGGEGQLPFAIEPGEKVRYIELTGDMQHGTIEFEADGGCKIFVGETIEYRDLRLAMTGAEAGEAGVSAERAAAGGQRQRIVKDAARSLQLACPACAGSLGAPQPGIDSMTCPACSTVVDLAAQQVACPQCGGGVQLHGEARMAVCNHCSHQMMIEAGEPKLLEGVLGKQRPKLPLVCGMRGKFEGSVFHVVGMIRFEEQDEGVRYHTDEWLLYNKDKGYRWLVCYEGHWSIGYTIRGQRPALKVKHAVRRMKFPYRERTWRVFEKSRYEAVWIEGELPWVAQVGDRTSYMDAVSPPYMLSAEWTENEVEWSLVEYMRPQEVALAFGIPAHKLPRRSGVGANQPFETTPFRSQSAMLMCCFALLMMFLSINSCSSNGTKVAEFSVDGSQYNGQEWLSPPFEIKSEFALCHAAFTSGVDNRWVYLDLAVVNAAELAVLDFSAQMSYYHGYEGGESWSEGSTKDGAVFKLQDSGQYRLLLTGQAGATETPYGAGQGDRVTITIYEGATLSRYYIILMILGLCWACFEWGRRGVHESQRWGSEDDD